MAHCLPSFLGPPSFRFSAYWPMLERIESAVTREECEALFTLAALTLGDGVVVEIGSYQGRSACAMGYGAALYRRGAVYTIDHHAGDPISGTMKQTWEVLHLQLRRASLEQTVFSIKAESQACAQTWVFPIRLLFLDGWHVAEAVQTDVNAWRPHLTPESVLAFHDYGRFGVTEVVDALRLNFAHTGRVGTVALLSQVPLPPLRNVEGL